MIDKQLKANIKKTKGFITLWVKFHDLYKSAAKKEAITQGEENLFLETKSLITNKYEALKNSLKLNTSGGKGMMDVITHVLSLKGMAAMSDRTLDRIEKNWGHSYIFLNGILKNLENQSRELAGKRRFFEFLKKIFSKKAIQVVVLVLAISIMSYIINVVINTITK